MVAIQLADPDKALLCLVPSVLLCVPARRLGAPEDTEEQQGTRQKLESQRYLPLRHLGGRDCAIDDIVDPEAAHSAALGAYLEDADKAAANGGGGL